MASTVMDQDSNLIYCYKELLQNMYIDMYRLSWNFMRFETSKHDEVASKFIGNISVRNATKRWIKVDRTRNSSSTLWMESRHNDKCLSSLYAVRSKVSRSWAATKFFREL